MDLLPKPHLLRSLIHQHPVAFLIKQSKNTVTALQKRYMSIYSYGATENFDEIMESEVSIVNYNPTAPLLLARSPYMNSLTYENLPNIKNIKIVGKTMKSTPGMGGTFKVNNVINSEPIQKTNFEGENLTNLNSKLSGMHTPITTNTSDYTLPDRNQSNNLNSILGPVTMPDATINASTTDDINYKGSNFYRRYRTNGGYNTLGDILANDVLDAFQPIVARYNDVIQTNVINKVSGSFGNNYINLIQYLNNEVGTGISPMEIMANIGSIPATTTSIVFFITKTIIDHVSNISFVTEDNISTLIVQVENLFQEK